MKNNKLENFIDRLKNVQLSETERAEVRASLAEHINANEPVRSPWAPLLSPLQNIARPAMVMAVVFLLVGGVSMAAENSLPGDPLYGVKVSVNEKVMGLTSSLSSVSEAENQSRIAARRISELEALAARGNLDSEVSNSLTQAISEHTESARRHIEDASRAGEAGSATSLETELLSILNTHSDILEDLAVSNDGTYATTTALAAETLRQLAQAKTEDDVSTTVNSSDSLRVRVNQDKQLSAQQMDELLERTATRLQEAQRDFENNYDTFKDASGIENLLIASAEKLDEAVDHLDNEQSAEATPLLREALTYAHEAQIIISTRRSLETSSGIAIDKLLDNNASSTATSGEATTTSDIEITSEDLDDVELLNQSENSTSTSASSSATSSTSSSSTSSATTSTSSEATSTSSNATNTDEIATTSSSSEQNFSRFRATSSEAYEKINSVLERVEEVLSVSESQRRAGLLPGRSSEEATSSEDAVE